MFAPHENHEGRAGCSAIANARLAKVDWPYPEGGDLICLWLEGPELTVAHWTGQFLVEGGNALANGKVREALRDKKPEEVILPPPIAVRMPTPTPSAGGRERPLCDTHAVRRGIWRPGPIDQMCRSTADPAIWGVRWVRERGSQVTLVGGPPSVRKCYRGCTFRLSAVALDPNPQQGCQLVQ